MNAETPATTAPKRPRLSAAERARRLLAETPAAPVPAAPEAAQAPLPVASGLTLVAASALVPYARNARTHSPEQVAALAQSIRTFGLAGALVVRDGTIAKGHGTLAACQRLFAAGEPVYPVPGQARGATPYPFGYLPVQDASGWTDAEFRAFVLADNQHALTAGWDVDLLKVEVDALLLDAIPLELIGFDAVSLQAALLPPQSDAPPDDADSGADTDPQVDRAEELRVKWGVETGQLWALGEHRLLCGDSTRADHVALLLGDDVPHLMVTDPPYGVEYDAEWRNNALRADGSVIGCRALGKVTNDHRADWRDAWALFPGDVAYVWHAPGALSVVVAESLVASAFEIRMQLIWAKSQHVIGRGHYHVQHEPCWYAVRKGKTGHWQGDRTRNTLWAIDKPRKSDTGHSTQKPVECMARPMRNNSARGDLVYEPFSGSGTTLIAGENLGRRVRAIEISPAYVAVALQRWADHTGRVPTLL